jgi:hypothetical protein
MLNFMAKDTWQEPGLIIAPPSEYRSEFDFTAYFGANF